ncbi:hypothetical protein GCM10009602_16390 [Nocardiopsis tropica]
MRPRLLLLPLTPTPPAAPAPGRGRAPAERTADRPGPAGKPLATGPHGDYQGRRASTSLPLSAFRAPAPQPLCPRARDVCHDPRRGLEEVAAVRAAIPVLRNARL